MNLRKNQHKDIDLREKSEKKNNGHTQRERFHYDNSNYNGTFLKW